MSRVELWARVSREIFERGGSGEQEGWRARAPQHRAKGIHAVPRIKREKNGGNKKKEKRVLRGEGKEEKEGSPGEGVEEESPRIGTLA